MNEPIFGTIINLNVYGGTVRLDDGRIAGIPPAELEANRPHYERAWNGRKNVAFIVRSDSRRLTAMLAPQIVDRALEEQIAQYLKSTEQWDVSDGAPAHERHFLRKKRRTSLFESQHSNER